MPRWQAFICAAALAGCATDGGDPADQADRMVSYDGISTNLLADDLVNFHLRMGGEVTRDDMDRYGRCAAAQYALIRGFGFARHVRTTVYKEGGVWTGDAVYTISPALPQGLQTLDAEVVVADCTENGIPTV